MGKLSNYASVVLLSYFAMRKHCNVRCRLALLYMYMHLASVNESASSSFFSSIGLENSPLISSSTPLNNRKKGSNPIGPGCLHQWFVLHTLVAFSFLLRIPMSMCLLHFHSGGSHKWVLSTQSRLRPFHSNLLVGPSSIFPLVDPHPLV